ncbi:MAG: PQQ-binding-like beta-propeller repeat protein [Verrucomicrobiota bacterium]
MKNPLITIFILTLCCLLSGQTEEQNNWPQWRGPFGTGEAAKNADPPISWNEKQNIKWKIFIPGLGHSTPVIWGDHIFLTTAIPVGKKLPPTYSSAPGAHDNAAITQKHDFAVLAFDRKSGKKLWQRTVKQTLPKAGGHVSGSLASASPCTDGKQVYAFFGSYGLYALDFDGKIKWQADLGSMHSKHGHGEGASPALIDNTLIVNWDHEKQSFVIAFDTKTGKQIWKKSRDENTSWSSSVAFHYKGKSQVLVSGTQRVRCYDVKNGDLIWECGGLSANVVATPIVHDGFAWVGSSYDTRALMAIRLKGAKGDISGSEHIIWSRKKRTPYVPSPLLYKDTLYYFAHYQPVISRVIAKTGEDLPGPLRLNGLRNLYASPVGAADRIYLTDLSGTTMVISHSKELPEMLADNHLDDEFSASPVIVDNQIFLRGRKLYCISK